MTELLITPTNRRAFLGGVGTLSGGLLLSGCASGVGGFSLTEAVRRLLLISSENAFARMTEPGGFWDRQVAQAGLNNLLGARGDVLSSILTSALFKSRLEREFAGFAIEASERAAPLVVESVRTVGIQNAIDLVRGGPTAATGFLRGNLGDGLLDAMVPGIWEAIRITREPLVGQAINALSGIDIAAVGNRLGKNVNDAIWTEIGREEAAIRANPRSTNDPVLIGVFGLGSRL